MGNSPILKKVLQHFAYMWILTALGLFVGSFLPTSVLMPVSILTVILLIVTIFVRNVKIANTLLYCIPFLMGITLFWSMRFYSDKLGQETVIATLVGTIVIFIILAIVGTKTKTDLSGWGKYLFGILLVGLLLTVIFIFFPPSNLILLGLAGAFVLIFVLYTIYDFNMIAQGHVSEDEVVSMALNLYLDFINLFVNLLEVIWRLKKEFE